jgi:rhamnulokinase
MPGSRAFVAVDLGATSGRVMLGRFDGERTTLDEAHRFPNNPVRYNGSLRWNMPELWEQIRVGLDAAGSITPDRIESIGVDSWGVDYALLGEGGTLLENPYHYRDSRTDGVMETVCREIGAANIYQRTGVQFLPINTLYQLYAASRRTPRLLAAADRLVMISDVVNFWLSGVVACEYTAASTTQFLSRETQLWATDLLRDLGIPTHFLTEIVPPGAVLGPLKSGITSSVNLSRSAVIAPACHDTGSAVASVRAGGSTAFLSSGTWSLLGTELAQPVVTPAARDLNFTNEGGVCGTIRLLKNITGLWLLEGCREEWLSEGSECPWDGLISSAYGAAPLRSIVDPDDPVFARPAHMREAIDSFCRETGQPVPGNTGEYVRTVLESLALKYRYVLEQIESVAGRSFTTIRVIGGGARNDALSHFTANATGREVLAGPAEATALGNVAIQMLASGCVQSLDEARDILERSYTPVKFEPSASSLWDSSYKTLMEIMEQRRATAVRAGPA